MKQTSEGELMARLANHLEEMPAVRKSAERNGMRLPKEDAWEIAHAVVDIQESASKVVEHLLPALLRSPPDSDEAEDILYMIGEEYRHILYHIRETSFFDYVVATND